ncbi:hypothetical protein SAMN04487846_1233 [Microbacterium sp. cf046]|uniref:lipopolysaccharide biosynthesis protein n=1 Tax=Microbacterium sp. cf046 TaxID=1761803 RepID=UPI0008EDB275|nr:hypothetical protein [Microbacterium sp. cf046]SFR95763.1 hypothetical protein SAMN04487846_1233 [Microbacterium sp. cf046]
MARPASAADPIALRDDDTADRHPTIPFIQRILSFSATVGLVAVVGVLAIPVLIASVGAEVWAQLTVIQVLAGVFGVIVAFGWGATGPSMIAGATREQRPYIFRESLSARLTLYAVAAPTMIVISLLLTRGDVPLSVLGTIAYLLPYVASPWYFVGQAQPGRLFVLNTIPAVVGTLVGLLATWLTSSITAFLLIQALGYLVAILLERRHILATLPPGEHARYSLRAVLALLGTQRHAVTGSLVSSLYVSLPLVTVQALIPAQVPVYAMADRLFKFGSLALAPVQQFLQGWVPEDGPAHIARRCVRAVVIGLAFGFVGGSLIAGFSPLASALLSGGAVLVPLSLSIPLGIAFLFVSGSAIAGYACLILLGQVRHVAIASIMAAAVGAPLILISASLHSLELIAWSVALSEFVVTIYQLVILRLTLRRGEIPPAAPEPEVA